MKTRLFAVLTLVAVLAVHSAWAPAWGAGPYKPKIGGRTAVSRAAEILSAPPNRRGAPLSQPAAVLNTGSITGTIYESDGVTPITAGAWVEALTADTGESLGVAEVNPDGTYTIEGLADGEYRVHATALAHAREFYDEAGANFPDATTVVVAGGSQSPNIDFTLDPGGAIAGIVYAADGVTPLGNVSIDTDYAWLRACSDSDGTYKLSFLPLNTPVKVKASGQDWCVGPDNYVREWWEETANYDLAASIVLTLVKPTATAIDFTLETGGSISGYVFESDGVTPIPDALVWAEDFETGNGNGVSTDAAGSFQIHGLASGDYRVRAEADGYAVEYYDNAGSNRDDATHVAVTAGSDTPDISFSLDSGGTISGEVYATDGVTPLVNVNVGLDNASPGACTILSGEFTILNVPLDAPYKVFAGGDNGCAGGSINHVQEWWQETIDFASASSVTLTEGAPHAGGINFTLTQPLYVPIVRRSP